MMQGDTGAPLNPSGGDNDDGPITFDELIKTADQHKKWYETIDWKQKLTLKNGYIAVSVCSFFLMALFGVVSITVHDDCFIAESTGRCCQCKHFSPEQLQGQQMPMGLSLNSLYYGLVMIINSLFGVYYVVMGVQSENKYQMLCMLATQFLECARGLVDTLLDDPDSRSAAERRDGATGLMGAATFLFFVSCVLLAPVYRSFGWAQNRRVGARRSILQMYKRYQKFRALNRLDVQSSLLIFLLFLGYVAQTEASGAWVWIVLFICDTFASRYMVKYLKQEDRIGVAICTTAKAFVISWWLVVSWQYYECYIDFEDSRAHISTWFDNPRLMPDLQEVVGSFSGTSCLGRNTFHDARTAEVIVLNLAQALIFRITSMAVGIAVVLNFGKGLKSALYDLDTEQAKIGRGETVGGDTDDAEDDDEPMQEFVPTRIVKAEDLAAAQSNSAALRDNSSVSSTNVTADYRQM